MHGVWRSGVMAHGPLESRLQLRFVSAGYCSRMCASTCQCQGRRCLSLHAGDAPPAGGTSRSPGHAHSMEISPTSTEPCRNTCARARTSHRKWTCNVMRAQAPTWSVADALLNRHTVCRAPGAKEQGPPLTAHIALAAQCPSWSPTSYHPPPVQPSLLLRRTSCTDAPPHTPVVPRMPPQADIQECQLDSFPLGLGLLLWQCPLGTP